MAGSITLTRQTVNLTELNWNIEFSGYPLTVTAVGTGDFAEDSNIFVLQLSGTGLDPNQGDIFNRIASIVDYTDLPTETTLNQMNESDIQGLITPFYRTNSITLFFDSLELADKAWNIIKADTKILIDNYNLKDMLNSSESITIS